MQNQKHKEGKILREGQIMKHFSKFSLYNNKASHFKNEKEVILIK